MTSLNRKVLNRYWGAANAVALIVGSVMLVAQGPPVKSIEFKTGKVDAKLDGKPCAADLDPGSASLDFYKSKGKDVQTFGASYSSNGQCSVRFALMNVHGPGKYGKESIQNFALSWNVSKAWNFNKAQDDCTFTLSRLEASGVDGSVSCSGNGPSIADFKFNAAP
jgi:hypothetical protein